MELNQQVRRSGRLSDILKQEMHISSGLMNRLKWDERILVNGIPRRTNYMVQQGDVVCLILDEPEPEYPAEDTPLEILYEDDHILAVDKDPGILIHPSRNRDSGTLANAVAGYYRRTGQKCAFHPVTRLDRDTYGVVLLAKNSHAHALLSECNAQGKLQKTYEALVFSQPPEQEGIVDAPIQRRPLPSLLRYVSPDGKPSRTDYRVLQMFGHSSLLELTPVTGRTHQLRIHCAYMGCPILGDPQYGTEESKAYSAQLGLTYQRLCAKRLEFIHPITGKCVHLKSKMSAEIEKNP